MEANSIKDHANLRSFDLSQKIQKVSNEELMQSEISQTFISSFSVKDIKTDKEMSLGGVSKKLNEKDKTCKTESSKRKTASF
jgi:hypothetical protein